MTDDSKLVDAYKSMYEHHQKDADGKVIEHEGEEEINEALPAALAPIAAGAAKVLPTIMKGVKVASKVAPALDIAKGLGNTFNPNKPKERGGTANNLEHVEIEHLDGGTTEIVDVVTPEPLGNPDENLADRLWDQVAANLTTLGEMAGVRYQVSPVEELQEKKKKKGKKLDPVGKEDADIDNDGDVDDSDSYLKKRREAIGKAMKKEEVEVETELDERACWDSHKKVGMKMKGGKLVNDCRPKNESFNVKSPVVFSKPEEKVEEPISEETIEKHASSILKAHKSIQK